MPSDRDKLLAIMSSLESDYKSGRISAEKYSYFRSKYEDKLNTIDAREATNRIRSMQGKKSNKAHKINKKPTRDRRKEEEDLVQKYIINPKKGDETFKKKKTGVESNTFKLILLLILVIAFTAGVAYGIFNFDYETVSETSAVAIVHDTAFPEIQAVVPNETNATYTNTSSEENIDNTDDTSDTGSTDNPSSYVPQDNNGGGSSDGGSSSSDNNGGGSSDGGSSDGGGTIDNGNSGE